MGFLGKLFGGSGGIEKELSKQYIPMLTQMGMSASAAKHTFSDMVSRAKEESKNEGTANLPEGFGDILLQKESNDQSIKTMLTKRRRESVTDEDIRWWWNMHDLERRIIQQIDNIFRMGVYSQMIEEGAEAKEAAISVRKKFPIMGDPEDTSNASGDDRPLPSELKDRINKYIQKRAERNPNEFKLQLENFSSCNAFIRHEISRGKI